MATTPVLHLFNAITRTELKLVKAGGFYHVGNKVYIGDLYTDSVGKGGTILNILREAPVEELPTPEITGKTKSVE